ncbi:UvrD-helicase domain-containing protein [Solimicrobium silvestre]|uniref:DNA 3'-5' helicase n=1 Tax=Solimicrobium silvestre TaxID=2099400 RepID=A0A2S9GV70_9BURK|nr:UvrD-helicase domain-containing protein [Solimicrobium silvestre]PRC91613.1 Superfamily I DNA and RNA helicase [Solimicrobium silvestre]
MQNLLHNLNPEQHAAVTLPAESALILAGAGSGKTRVLTTRIAWLIQTGQISPSGLMAVTFTNKAAKEMQARLSAMLPINTRSMWIGTFHGLCNRLLRAHHKDASLPQTFQILDSQDQLSMVKRILKANQIDDDKYPPRTVVYFINSAKEQGLRAAKVVTHDPISRQLAEIYGIYEQQCQRDGVVDFAELLLRTVELLASNQPLREHYQARFKHILVDEFQDTNDLQYRWIKLMAGSKAAVLAVGDDDQSIYAFRGANVGNMASFEREFQVQNRIKLEQNYRSHGHILDSANALISNNTERLGKNLRTDAGLGEVIRIQEASSDREEAQWMVEQIKDLTRQGISSDQIALLYRSNAQSRVIEHALFSANLPYRVYGGLRFFERAEIKHAIAYLQLMDNPHNDSAFLRVMNFPTRGIGAKGQETLQDTARQHGISLYAAVPYLAGKAGSTLGAFVKLIEAARFETQMLPLPELVQRVLELSTLITHYQSEKEGADRVENLEQLVSAAALFISEEGFANDAPALMGPASTVQTALVQGDGMEIMDADAALATLMSPLSAFLSHASLEAGDNQAQVGQDALQLMTVHSAKGLEFDAVFITGLEEGLFPHENSAKETNGIEEERRLMYVAITRARQRLFLSFAQTRMLHGQIRYNTKSRFLNELPDENVKWLTPQIKQNWFAPPKSAWDSDTSYSGNSSFQAKPVNPSHHSIIPTNADGWRIGLSVKHAKFGEGIIIKLEGSGTNCRAHIQFYKLGLKVLDLNIAKLEKV